jgi:NADPH:quinone reductase-like Zn-dependent oxidoreductase
MPSGTPMRALALTAFDAEPTMMDVPAPEPTAREVLVRVRAASVNAYDVVVARGITPMPARTRTGVRPP